MSDDKTLKDILHVVKQLTAGSDQEHVKVFTVDGYINGKIELDCLYDSKFLVIREADYHYKQIPNALYCVDIAVPVDKIIGITRYYKYWG